MVGRWEKMKSKETKGREITLCTVKGGGPWLVLAIFFVTIILSLFVGLLILLAHPCRPTVCDQLDMKPICTLSQWQIFTTACESNDEVNKSAS